MIHEPEKIKAAYEEGRIRKILVIRISRLGDLIFTTPALRGLKARFPRAQIHVLTNPYSSGALKGNPYIAAVHLLDRKRFSWRFFRSAPVLKTLRKEGFDLAIPLRWREEYASLFKSIKVPLVFKPCPGPPEGEALHQADRHVAGLAALGVEGDGLGMEVFTSQEEDRAANAFMARAGLEDKPCLVFHAGCHQTLKGSPLKSTAKRAWPVAHWAELIRLVERELCTLPVLAGFSEGDRSLNVILCRSVERDCPTFTDPRVGAFAGLLRRARGFVCLDSGPLHVASAAGVPTLALFGPSRPFLTGPYRNRRGARVLQKNIPCSPCKGKKIRCTDNICMRQIAPEEVWKNLHELMNLERVPCQ